MQIPKDEIRKQILLAATNEFYTKDFRSASMRSIAFAAETGLSNLYNYFESKEKLFEEIIFPVYSKYADFINRLDSVETQSATPGFSGYLKQMTSELGAGTEQSRKLMVILMHKSKGTKYENAAQEFINLLELHFLKFLKETGVSGSDEGYLCRLIASNFVSGYMRLIQEYQNDAWFEENLNRFMQYHLAGLFSLKP